MTLTISDLKQVQDIANAAIEEYQWLYDNYIAKSDVCFVLKGYYRAEIRFESNFGIQSYGKNTIDVFTSTITTVMNNMDNNADITALEFDKVFMSFRVLMNFITSFKDCLIDEDPIQQDEPVNVFDTIKD